MYLRHDIADMKKITADQIAEIKVIMIIFLVWP